MAQIDPFAGFGYSPTRMPDRHFLIVPSDTQDLPVKPTVVHCESAGTIVIRDAGGVDLPYTCQAGDRVHCRPTRVLETGTDGVWYGQY